MVSYPLHIQRSFEQRWAARIARDATTVAAKGDQHMHQGLIAATKSRPIPLPKSWNVWIAPAAVVVGRLVADTAA
jgi:hypothetical protein